QVEVLFGGAVEGDEAPAGIEREKAFGEAVENFVHRKVGGRAVGFNRRCRQCPGRAEGPICAHATTAFFESDKQPRRHRQAGRLLSFGSPAMTMRRKAAIM